MMERYVSDKCAIIIPTYNGEKFISETVFSALNQDYANLEVLVIDDCSVDSTRSILDGISNAKLKKIYRPKNFGLVQNVNFGVGLTDAEFILLLGHDDILESSHVTRLLSLFDPGIGIVHCNSIKIDESGREGKLSRLDIVQSIKSRNPLFWLSIDNFVSSCGLIFRHQLFDQLGGWDTRYRLYGEWLMFSKFAELSEFRYTSSVRARYRQHGSNITKSIAGTSSLDEYKRYSRSYALAAMKGAYILSMLRAMVLFGLRFKVLLRRVCKGLLK